MLSADIHGYLRAHRPQHLAELKEFVRFPSISAQPEHQSDCEACASWLVDRIRKLGMATELDTGVPKPVVLGRSEVRPDRPTLLVYGHYDVQPPDPLELWESPPFELTECNGTLYARGASDDKGQVYTWLKAAEAYLAVEGDLPVNLKFFIEGEEEVGSPAQTPFMVRRAEWLKCDACAISDSGFFAPHKPSICYGLRGLVYVEITLTGPRMDLHSGLYGGAVTNPINALAGLIAGLHDGQRRVTVPNFYDDVSLLTVKERQAWTELGFSDSELMEDLGVDALTGEEGYTTLERIWGRPTLDCNGIWGGYTGAGPKTVLPSWAKAKLSCRLVCHQDPDRVISGLRQYFRDDRPPGTQVELEVLSADQPWLMPPDSPDLAAAREAMTEAFGQPCTLIRGGGSIPVTTLIRKHLGVDCLLMGYGMPDDRAHSPNEKLPLEQFYLGIVAGAALMRNLAQRGK